MQQCADEKGKNNHYVWTDNLAWDPGSHGSVYTSK